MAVTAAQVRGVITRLIEAGHWRQGDPRILMDGACDGFKNATENSALKVVITPA